MICIITVMTHDMNNRHHDMNYDHTLQLIDLMWYILTGIFCSSVGDEEWKELFMPVKFNASIPQPSLNSGSKIFMWYYDLIWFSFIQLTHFWIFLMSLSVLVPSIFIDFVNDFQRGFSFCVYKRTKFVLFQHQMLFRHPVIRTRSFLIWLGCI